MTTADGLIGEVWLQLEPHKGLTYSEILAVATVAEKSGFDGLSVSDHYLAIAASSPGAGPTDAWVTLAGLARDTNRLRLATLMTAATFRTPLQLAVIATEVDEMSSGRLEVGVGAGWFAHEHRVFGFTFPHIEQRFDDLETTLSTLRRFWNATGSQNLSEGAPALPRPTQDGGPPLIVGGIGPRRTPALAARYADEFNVPPFTDEEAMNGQMVRVDEACRAIGRDPASLARSAYLTAVITGASTSDVQRRRDDLSRLVPEPERYTAPGLMGPPPQVAAALARYGQSGISRLYLGIPDQHDLDHIDLLGRQVLPLVRDG